MLTVITKIRALKTGEYLLTTLIVLFSVPSWASGQASLPKACEGVAAELKLAEESEARQDWATAVAQYKHALTIKPDCAEANVNLGAVYNRLNDPERAIAAFQQALTQNNRLTAAHINLGITYFRTKRYELAVESLQRVLKIDPVNLQAHKLLALSLIAQDKFAEASLELDKILVTSPDDGPTLFSAAETYLHLKQYKRAAIY